LQPSGAESNQNYCSLTDATHVSAFACDGQLLRATPQPGLEHCREAAQVFGTAAICGQSAQLSIQRGSLNDCRTVNASLSPGDKAVVVGAFQISAQEQQPVSLAFQEVQLRLLALPGLNDHSFRC
jgi:hypothetical protein